MDRRAVYNWERLQIYGEMFTSLVRGRHVGDVDVQDAYANLLIDIRWPDVSKAFAHVLHREACLGEIRPLAVTFERLASKAALAAFGTSSHEDIPSWFLQNFECFLASTLHKLLGHFRNPLGPPLSAMQRRCAARTFHALMGVAEGLRSYVGLDYLSKSRGVHVLMSAVHNAKCDLLNEVVVPSPRCSVLVFANVLAAHVLLDPNRELVVESSFCFFARSDRWRAFGNACHCACIAADVTNAPLARLLREVDEARHRTVSTPPGLFFLASEFLEADASPERALKVARASKLNRESRSPIAKRSQPFLRLVKRLLSGSA